MADNWIPKQAGMGAGPSPPQARGGGLRPHLLSSLSGGPGRLAEEAICRGCLADGALGVMEMERSV